MAKEKREEFKRQRERLVDGEGLIVFDFKQNLQIGIGPRQLSQEYYQLTQQSVLGFERILSQHHIDTTYELYYQFSKQAKQLKELNNGPERIFLLYERDARPPTYKHISCDDFKNRHYFCRKGQKLLTKVLSNQPKAKLTPFKITTKKDQRKSKVPPPVDRSFEVRHSLTKSVLDNIKNAEKLFVNWDSGK